jgi:hypothetical protein
MVAVVSSAVVAAVYGSAVGARRHYVRCILLSAPLGLVFSEFAERLNR